jgi:beclin
MEELKAAELELSNLQSEITRLEAESTALNAEEAAFWRSRNAFSLSLEEFQNERDEVNIKYDHDAKLLERLQRTNVYNDAFCITHDGFFGVINGLRLGRLPNKQVRQHKTTLTTGRME